MADLSAPLQGTGTNVLANLANVRARRDVRESNLATAEQGRELRGQNIRLTQRKIEAPELASIFMDIQTIPILLNAGNTKEAGQLGILLRDRLREAGEDKSADEWDRVLKLASVDPAAASKFITENYLPALSAITPDVMRQTKDAQGNPVFEGLISGPVQPEIVPASQLTDEGQLITRGAGGLQATDVPGFTGAAPDSFDPSVVTADSPASVQEFAFRELLSEEEQKRFSSQERSSQFQRLGDEVVQFGADGEEIARFNIGLAPRDEPTAVSEREKAATNARLGAQRAFDAGAERGVANNIKASTDTMIAAIDNILQHPGLGTATGLSGTFDPRTIIPGTEASDVRILINQLKDRVFVEALNGIRAQSKTGGAVGQVSDREGGRLENMMGALSRSLSDEEFIKQLRLIKTTAQNTANLADEAFENQFGDINLTGDTELDIILQQIDALN